MDSPKNLLSACKCHSCEMPLVNGEPKSPVPHLLGTSTPNVPTQEECQTIIYSLAFAEAKLQDINAALQSLEREKEALLQFKKSHEMLLSVWQRTPMDVWIEIFSWYMASRFDVPIYSFFPRHMVADTQSPFILAQVCKHWRQIVLRTPKLWAYLSLILIPESPKVLDMVKIRLARSKEVGLSVYLQSPAPLEDLKVIYNVQRVQSNTAWIGGKCFDLLLADASRWKHLYLEVDRYTQLEALLHATQGRLTQLRSITITRRMEMLGAYNTARKPARIDIDAPLLRDVELVLNESPSFIGLPFSNLRYLTLDLLKSQADIDMAMRGADISVITGVYDILSECRSLVSLNLELPQHTGLPDRALEPLVQQSLRVLNITLTPVVFNDIPRTFMLKPLLQFLSCPHLEELSIIAEGWGWDDDVRDFILQSRSTLRKLKLSDQLCRIPALRNLFSALHSLTDFEVTFRNLPLHRPTTRVDAIRALISPADGDPILPSLRRLRLTMPSLDEEYLIPMLKGRMPYVYEGQKTYLESVHISVRGDFDEEKATALRLLEESGLVITLVPLPPVPSSPKY